MIESTTKVTRKLGWLTWVYGFSLLVPILNGLPLKDSDVLTVMVLIVLARLSLFVPLLVPLELDRPVREGESEAVGLKDGITMGMWGTVGGIAVLWWRGAPRRDISEPLFEHPAVSALVFDLIISLISTFVFIARLSWIDYCAKDRARTRSTATA